MTAAHVSRDSLVDKYVSQKKSKEARGKHAAYATNTAVVSEPGGLT